MIIEEQAFPRRSALWQGAIFSTIAHAIWIMTHPIFAYEKAWNDHDYTIQNSEGAHGVITFAEETTIGMFFDVHSPRNPFRSKAIYDLDHLLSDMPTNIRFLAEQKTLQYMLDEYEGWTTPIITASFWSRGEYLTASEPWAKVLVHGAHLIHAETLPLEDSITILQERYEFTPGHINLLQSLFNRRMHASVKSTVLTDTEIKAISQTDCAGIKEARELLASVNIVLP